jgi:hypothetical protein
MGHLIDELRTTCEHTAACDFRDSLCARDIDFTRARQGVGQHAISEILGVLYSIDERLGGLTNSNGRREQRELGYLLYPSIQVPSAPFLASCYVFQPRPFEFVSPPSLSLMELSSTRISEIAGCSTP